MNTSLSLDGYLSLKKWSTFSGRIDSAKSVSLIHQENPMNPIKGSPRKHTTSERKRVGGSMTKLMREVIGLVNTVKNLISKS